MSIIGVLSRAGAFRLSLFPYIIFFEYLSTVRCIVVKLIMIKKKRIKQVE